jgi:isoamylase
VALKIESGEPLPLGAHPWVNCNNFAVFSRHATAVSLLLFDHPQDTLPASILHLDPARNRTVDFWHLRVNYCVDYYG